MNIWIVNPFDNLPNEGTQNGRYASLALLFAQRGHNVHWWSSSFRHATKSQREPLRENSSMITVHLVPTSKYKKNISFARIRNHMQYGSLFRRMAVNKIYSKEIESPDRIFVSVPPLSVLRHVFKLRKKVGGKVVLDIQDAWPEAFYRIIPLGGIVGRYLFFPIFQYIKSAYKKADGISGVAFGYISQALAVAPLIPFNITPIGISIGQFDKVSHIPGKKRWSNTFIYLGSMSANYDLRTILRATKKMIERSYGIKIIFAGTGPHEKLLKRQAAKLRIQDNIDFRGQLDISRLAQALAESDVALNCVLPESYCLLPNKVGDYFAAGLPIINSLPGEFQALLKNTSSGVQYRAGDSDSLAEAMRYYLDNHDIAVQHGKNARKLAELEFNRDKTYPLLADFIERI